MTTNERKLQNTQAAESGLLLARPAQPTTAAPIGLQPLAVSDKCDALLYVPPTYQVKQPAPLVVMLHGAGGDAHGGLKLLMPFAEAAGLILLAPTSRQKTWDIIFGNQYGFDIALLDTALAQVFSRYAIDQNRIAIGGFSDGASYALSVGITNGDLFTHVIAFGSATQVMMNYSDG